MIDLALMAKLFAAVPRNARIILLGDKDQLASVEAGRVLGDICPSADLGPVRPGARTGGRHATARTARPRSPSGS